MIASLSLVRALVIVEQHIKRRVDPIVLSGVQSLHQDKTTLLVPVRNLETFPVFTYEAHM